MTAPQFALAEQNEIYRTEQKVVRVSTEEEFNEAIGDFTTVILTGDIFIKYQETGDSYQDNFNGIFANNKRSLLIEGGGYKIDGQSQNVPRGDWDQRCMTIVGGDVTVNDLTVTNCGCTDGAISVFEGAAVQITNSRINNNLNGITGGGLQLTGKSDHGVPTKVTLTNVTIDENTSDYGGGIYAYGGYRGGLRTALHMIDCKVLNNKAENWGGGLYIEGADVADEGVLFTNNVGYTQTKKPEENDVYANMNAGCSTCWSSHFHSSPCPDKGYVSNDEGPIQMYPEKTPAPRSYSCTPKE